MKKKMKRKTHNAHFFMYIFLEDLRELRKVLLTHCGENCSNYI